MLRYIIYLFSTLTVVAQFPLPPVISYRQATAEETVNSPTNIPNIYRWYDADYQATYIDGDFMETATPWTNRVSGTDNLTGTGSARPTFRPLIQNSKPGWLFDGSDDVATMTTLGAQSSFTAVGIFRITEAHATATMGLLDDSAGNSEIWISATTGPDATKLRVDDASDTLAESSALSTIVWTNAMMGVWAVDGTDAKFYWNGTNYGTDSAMGSIGSFTLDRMGAAAGLQFKGYMHEWIIYTNYKASATQVGQLWSNYISNKWFAGSDDITSGLVGWWKMNDGSGTTATDSTGNGNTGTLQGGTSWTTGPSGNGATSYDGTGDYISVANEANFDFETNSAFSFSLWLKANAGAAGTGSKALISKVQSTGNNPGIDFRYNSDTGFIVIYLIQADGNVILSFTANASIAVNTDYFVAATYDGSSTGAGLKVYINNASGVAGSGTLTQSILNNQALWIGDSTLINEMWGIMDDVRIYNRELSSGEILTLYNNTAK